MSVGLRMDEWLQIQRVVLKPQVEMVDLLTPTSASVIPGFTYFTHLFLGS